MADYKTMYLKLFNEMGDTIERFKSKLLEVEEIYIETSEEKNITILENEYDEE